MGGPQGLADNHAAYLRDAGAWVERVADVSAASRSAPATDSGVTVWVVDDERVPPSAHELDAAVQASAQLDIRVVVVVIGRGRRRLPRSSAPGVIAIDGNVLSRRRFLEAVALAAGRSAQDGSLQQVGDDGRARQRNRTDGNPQPGGVVLVAEDNETNQKVIMRQLELLRFSADVVGNGEEALRRWREGGYSLILTDVHMPAMDGYALTAAIRREEAGTRRIPIVAISANALREEAQRCLDAGMDDYLAKPMQVVELAAMLKKWMPKPPVDLSVLEAIVGRDADVIAGFVRDFRASAAATVGQISAACSAGDAAGAAALAHRLKSSALTMGAVALGRWCAQIEEEGGAGNVETLHDLLPGFVAEHAAVDAWLAAL